MLIDYDSGKLTPQNIPEVDPEDFKDFTLMQVGKYVIAIVGLMVIGFLLLQINHNLTTLIKQNGEILQRLHE